MPLDFNRNVSSISHSEIYIYHTYMKDRGTHYEMEKQDFKRNVLHSRLCLQRGHVHICAGVETGNKSHEEV